MSPRGEISHLHIFSHHETPHLLVVKDTGRRSSGGQNDSQQNSDDEDDAERDPLLSPENQSRHHPRSIKRQGKLILRQTWKGVKSVLNPPLMGGVAAIIVGIIPLLHKLVFSEHAPLATVTDSIASIGKLYTALQTFVVGGQLYSKR